MIGRKPDEPRALTLYEMLPIHSMMREYCERAAEIQAFGAPPAPAPTFYDAGPSWLMPWVWRPEPVADIPHRGPGFHFPEPVAVGEVSGISVGRGWKQ